MVGAIDGKIGDQQNLSVDVVEGLINIFFALQKSRGWEFAGDFFDFIGIVGEIVGGDSEINDYSSTNCSVNISLWQMNRGGMDRLDDETH